MPIISSDYKGPPFYLINGHAETIVPSVWRTVTDVNYTRERIQTPDNDFLDLDWLRADSKKLLVVSHGLEGDSGRHYVRGMAKLFNQNGWNVVAWNNRSCSGEMNRQRILYHHGASYDLRTVVDHASTSFDFNEIALVGMSLGGGQTLRYLGEHPDFPLPQILTRAVAISVPCSLIESVETLAWKSNRVYERKFMQRLKKKIIAKAAQYPDIDVSNIDSMKTFEEFDERYTAPIHGFKSSDEFYEFCNPTPFMKEINIPTLVLNALNDPLLKGECYPYELAKKSNYIFLETPKRGGHVGYVQSGSNFTYSEERAYQFISEG